jgi:hypothetical protein
LEYLKEHFIEDLDSIESLKKKECLYRSKRIIESEKIPKKPRRTNMHNTNPITFESHLRNLHQDAVIWKAAKLYKPGLSPDDKQSAVDEIAEMLSCITHEVKRDTYFERIQEDLKIKKGHLRNALTNKITVEEDKQQGEETRRKLPPWAQVDRVYNFSLDWKKGEGHNTGYYYLQSNNSLIQLTNFVLEPLFHIYDRTGGNRRLARLHNAINPDKIIELPSKALISLDKFEELLADEGYYQTLEGFGKPHLKRLFRAIGNDFPKTYELKVLGWQPEGFWSYSDAIFNGENIQRFNDIGVARHRETFYYSPSSSSIYKSDRKDDDGREVMDDDPYENDKSLRYQKSPVSFETWCKHMMLMHKDSGMPLIAYAFVSLFKDIITAYEKCPLLYGYGLVQSGKSTWAEGLYYLFNDYQSKPFNLNQGTIYAFWNRMERFRNCPQLYNEFDEDNIDDEFFRAFKAFYDGEGRDRGKGIKGKTETQKTNCTVILIGQTLTTKDGASVLIRSIPVKHHDPGERTDQEKANYDTWFAWVNQGMNSCLTDVMIFRKQFKANFFRTFNEELIKLKNLMRQNEEPFKERIAKNYCILLTSAKVMMDHLQLGFTYSEFFNYCRKQIVDLSRMISEVDNLATFWKTIEFLYEKGDLIEGQDFKLIEELEVRKSIGDKETISVPFEKHTKILYLRLSKAYPLYAQNYRQTTGSKGINESTLLTYFQSSRQYIGNNPSSWFSAPGGKRSNTSSYMFEYSRIGINLERSDALSTDDRKPVEITGTVSRLPELIANGDVMKFSIVVYEQVTIEGSLPKTIKKFIKCFSNDISKKDLLFMDCKVQLLGLIEEKKLKGDFVMHTMDVEQLSIISSVETFKTSQTTVDFTKKNFLIIKYAIQSKT